MLTISGVLLVIGATAWLGWERNWLYVRFGRHLTFLTTGTMHGKRWKLLLFTCTEGDSGGSGLYAAPYWGIAPGPLLAMTVTLNGIKPKNWVMQCGFNSGSSPWNWSEPVLDTQSGNFLGAYTTEIIAGPAPSGTRTVRIEKLCHGKRHGPVVAIVGTHPLPDWTPTPGTWWFYEQNPPLNRSCIPWPSAFIGAHGQRLPLYKVF